MANKFLKTLKLPGINEPYKIPQTAEDVGARPVDWMPTASDVGAAPAGYGFGEQVYYTNILNMTSLDQLFTSCYFAISESQVVTVNNISFASAYGRCLAFMDGRVYQELMMLGNTTKLVRYCFNGTWSEWECENPPMDVGVEYRTTERYDGKPVYRKLIKYTNTTTMGNISGSVDYNIPHGISGFSELVELNARYGTRTMIPYPTYKTISGTVYASVSGVTVVSDTNIVMRITNDTFNPADWFFSLAYTKS